jgi:hypothetical protein
MKLHETVTHNTRAADSNSPRVLLKAVPATGHTESEPPHDDIVIQPSTMLRAKHRGIDEGFVLLIKEIALLALEGFERGDRVDSTMLCAEIRYGLRKDALVDDGNVPGLSKGERLDAGRVIWILADAGELPLVPLGRNGANLQQYRVK